MGVLSRKTTLLEAFLLLVIGSSNAAQQGCTVELADKRALVNNAETLCDSNDCFWIAATEQDGTETGRCYQCSQQQTQEDCTFTNICIWFKGRNELGGKDW
jgi:recombinational DNA repair ATPase RecF